MLHELSVNDYPEDGWCKTACDINVRKLVCNLPEVATNKYFKKIFTDAFFIIKSITFKLHIDRINRFYEFDQLLMPE